MKETREWKHSISAKWMHGPDPCNYRVSCRQSAGRSVGPGPGQSASHSGQVASPSKKNKRKSPSPYLSEIIYHPRKWSSFKSDVSHSREERWGELWSVPRWSSSGAPLGTVWPRGLIFPFRSTWAVDVNPRLRVWIRRVLPVKSRPASAHSALISQHMWLQEGHLSKVTCCGARGVCHDDSLDGHRRLGNFLAMDMNTFILMKTS